MTKPLRGLGPMGARSTKTMSYMERPHDEKQLARGHESKAGRVLHALLAARMWSRRATQTAANVGQATATRSFARPAFARGRKSITSTAC